MERLHRLGIYHGVHHNTANCGVFGHMNPDEEEEELDYDIIGDMPEEEPEEGNIDIEHQGWMRRQ